MNAEDSLEATNRELMSTNRELVRTNRELERQLQIGESQLERATTDPLTRLPDARRMQEALKRLLLRLVEDPVGRAVITQGQTDVLSDANFEKIAVSLADVRMSVPNPFGGVEGQPTIKLFKAICDELDHQREHRMVHYSSYGASSAFEIPTQMLGAGDFPCLSLMNIGEAMRLQGLLEDVRREIRQSRHLARILRFPPNIDWGIATLPESLIALSIWERRFPTLAGSFGRRELLFRLLTGIARVRAERNLWVTSFSLQAGLMHCGEEALSSYLPLLAEGLRLPSAETYRILVERCEVRPEEGRPYLERDRRDLFVWNLGQKRVGDRIQEVHGQLREHRLTNIPNPLWLELLILLAATNEQDRFLDSSS